MKKIFLLALFAGAVLASCEKEEIGGTATMPLSGEWICTSYYSDTVSADVINWKFFYGYSEVYTFNTAENIPSEMWINDEGFWFTQCKVNCSVDDMTFGSKDSIFDDVIYGTRAKIWGGKITPGGAIAPGSGSKVDKIEYYAQFEDDIAGGGPFSTTYYLVGYRRTGFESDENTEKTDWELPEQH